MKRVIAVLASFLAFALSAVLPDAPRVPVTVKFSQHQFVKRGHARSISGGQSIGEMVAGLFQAAYRGLTALADLPLRMTGFSDRSLVAGHFMAPGIEMLTPDGNLGPAAEVIANSGGLQVMRPVLASNMDPLAANATLRHDEWEMVDERINQVFRERLTVADDLRSRGLVQPVSVGTIIRRTERLHDTSDAEISYDGDAAPQRDRPQFSSEIRPVPIISKGFQFGFRQLDASRNRGEPLDLTAAEQAARKVRDRLQALITLGVASGGPSGGGIPGLVTAGNNRMTVSLQYNWDSAEANLDIVGDVQDMLAEAYANSCFGPFVLYVPKNYWATIQGDYSTQKGDRTYLERILAFSEIDAVRPLDALADDNVVLVQMTRDVIDLSEAQTVTTVQWQKNPFVTEFRVLMIGGPHLKTIQTDQDTTISGVVHLS